MNRVVTSKMRMIAVLPDLLILAAACLLPGCAVNRETLVYPSSRPSSLSICRAAVTPSGTQAAFPIAWTAPVSGREREALDAWCDSAGPPVIASTPALPISAADFDDFVVVSWNVHVGAADVAELVRRLRAGMLTGGQPVAHFTLLLQEAYRAGPVVPRAARRALRGPRAIRPQAPGRARADVVRLAETLGLALYYVPSMRNGRGVDTDEDRGNAIMSTDPLSDFAAIELPFERQRRVAVAATITHRGQDDERWTVRVASAHLDNLASARRLWIIASGARVRQARGLLQSLGTDSPVVLGGDFNTWFGFDDPAYREIAGIFPGRGLRDRRPTFAGVFRLDHLFFRLPDGWDTNAVRLDDRLGSDHHPLLARISIPDAS